MDTEPVDPRDPEAPRRLAAPSPDAVRRMLAGVMDPELKASIVDLGMVDDVTVDADGVVDGPHRAHHARLPAPGRDQKEIQSKVAGLPGVTDVKVHCVEMTQEQRTAAMQAAR